MFSCIGGAECTEYRRRIADRHPGGAGKTSVRWPTCVVAVYFGVEHANFGRAVQQVQQTWQQRYI